MRRLLLLITWLITDAVLFLGAYAVAYFLKVGLIISSDFPLNLYLQTVAIIIPLWLLIMAELGIFKLFRVQSDKKNILYILFSCVMGSSLFTLAYYFLHDRFFSRLLLVEAGVLSFIFTLIWHLAFDQWQRRVLRRSPPAYPVLLVGANRDTERFVTLLNETQSPLKPVGILDPEGSKAVHLGKTPILGKLNKLEEVIKELKPKYLVQCSNLEHSINLLSACRNHKMTYMLLPSVLGIMGGDEEFVMIEGQPMAMVRE